MSKLFARFVKQFLLFCVHFEKAAISSHAVYVLSKRAIDLAYCSWRLLSIIWLSALRVGQFSAAVYNSDASVLQKTLLLQLYIATGPIHGFFSTLLTRAGLV